MTQPRSVFLLLILFWCSALPAIQASGVRPHGVAMTGVVRSVDDGARRLVFAQEGGSVREVIWLRSTQFRRGAGSARPAELRPGMRVRVLFHDPLFGRSYVSRVDRLE